MSDPNEIRPIGPTQFDRVGEQPGRDARRQPHPRSGGGDQADAEGRGPRDRVEISDRHEVLLAMLRERVLVTTRSLLELNPVDPARSRLAATKQAHTFVEAPTDRVDVFVGRLLSAQNALVAERRKHGEGWSEARLDAAVSDGTERGVSETIDILEELGRMDGENWEVVHAVLAELARKLGGRDADADESLA